MPVLKFNFQPPPVTDDPTTRMVPAVGNGDHVKVQSQAFGDPVGGQLAVESIGDHVQPASLYSTAPYKPDGLHAEELPKWERPRNKQRRGRCMANGDTCRGFSTNRWPGLCAAHGMAAERSETSTSTD
jgi:hypothetical protein